MGSPRSKIGRVLYLKQSNVLGLSSHLETYFRFRWHILMKWNVRSGYMCVTDELFCNHLYSLERNLANEMETTIIMKKQELKTGK